MATSRTEGWTGPSALVVTAFAIRLVHVLIVGDGLTFPDEYRFWSQIETLVTKGFLSAGSYQTHDMPLTAIVLAFFVKITGTGVLGAKVFLAGISACTTVLVARIAFNLNPTRLSWWIGGITAAMYPFFVFYSAHVLSETLFLFLAAWLFLHLTRGEEGNWLTISLLAGLAHLTRPTLLYFMPLLWVYQAVIVKVFPWKLAGSVVVFCLVIAPWVVRNYQEDGEFLATTTGSGHVLWEGNNPWNQDGGIERPGWRYLDDLPSGLSPFQRHEWEKDRALAFIASDPGRFLRMSGRKFLRFWHLWPNAPEYAGGVYKWASLLSFGPVLFLSLASLWFLRDRWRRTLPMWLFAGYLTLLHMILFGSIRYRLPLEPLLIAMAAACAAKLVGWVTAGPRNGPSDERGDSCPRTMP